MKKTVIFLSILALMLCFLAVGASAEEPAVTDTFYVVASQDSAAAQELKAQGKDVVVLSEIYASTSKDATGIWLDNFAEGSHIELVFAENVIESVDAFQGILLNKNITLTVRYNGFCHLVTNGNRENVFVLRHCDARLNLIGTSEIYSESGDVITDFTYNSGDLSQNKVQVRHGKVYAWVFDGDVYVENLRASTGEEVVFSQDDDNTSDAKINTYEFVNCAFTSGSVCIGLDGRDNAQKIVKINGGYYSSIHLQMVCNGSYIQRCKIDKYVMDCYSITNQMLVFDNCEISSITTYTGRTHVTLIDCDFDVSKLSLGSDGGGSGYALIYFSATCETDGTLNVYKNGSGTTPVNDDAKYASTVEAYYADPQNKALGHSYSWVHSYEGEKYVSALTAENTCSNCKAVSEAVSVDAMFSTLGYSVPEFGDEFSITVGYVINKSAIEKYEELTGCTVNFGCVVALKEKLGEFNAPLDESGNAVVLQSGKVIKTDVTKEPYAYMDLKVELTSEHADLSLLMTMFIIEASGDDVQVSYLQNNDKLVQNNQFTYVSYNNH